MSEQKSIPPKLLEWLYSELYLREQMNDHFKFKVTMGWELFSISILAGLGIALFTVRYHALKLH